MIGDDLPPLRAEARNIAEFVAFVLIMLPAGVFVVAGLSSGNWIAFSIATFYAMPQFCAKGSTNWHNIAFAGCWYLAVAMLPGVAFVLGLLIGVDTRDGGMNEGALLAVALWVSWNLLVAAMDFFVARRMRASELSGENDVNQCVS